jgi:hypothetical protein
VRDGVGSAALMSLLKDVKSRGLDIRSSACLAHFAENLESEDTRRLLSTLQLNRRGIVKSILQRAKQQPAPQGQREASNKKARKSEKVSKAVVPLTVTALHGKSCQSSDKARLVN